MKKKLFLISFVGFFLTFGIAYAEGTAIHSGKAACDKNLQSSDVGPSSASDEIMAAPKGFSEPEKEAAGSASEDISEKASEQKDVPSPATPEKTISGE